MAQLKLDKDNEELIDELYACADSRDETYEKECRQPLRKVREQSLHTPPAP